MKKKEKEPKIGKKILDYLDKNKYKYEIVKHRITYTSWDTAQTKKIKPQEVAKTLAIKTDKDWIVAVLPSDKNLDKKGLLKIINTEKKKRKENSVKKLDFADEKWLKKNMKIGKLGAIPPFRLLEKEIYFDKALQKSKKIYINSGEYNASFKISTSQYLKNEKPIMGKFSVKKPKK